MSRFAAFFLLLTAAVCGAAVMAMELLGARMLSVAFGGSVVVWAAMISVTLLSLAVGYALGGWLCDRLPRPALVYAYLLAGAALLAACPRFTFVIRRCYDAFGIRGGALASSGIVFFLPLALMGMVSPSIIRLLCQGTAPTAGRRAGKGGQSPSSKRTENGDSPRRGVGVRAGGVYAISTLGSVAGTLLTGLWLIPGFGTAAGFRLTALALGVTGAVGLLTRLGVKAAPALLVPLAVGLLRTPAPRAGLTYTSPEGHAIELLAVRESVYGHMTVLQDRQDRYRLLVVDGIVQTGIPTDIARLQKGACLRMDYFQELLPYMVDEPARCSALVIGLAGGMTASMLRLYDIDVQAVDLDGQIIRLAREFFSFTGPAVVADGRQYLQRCDRKFDFCIIDTYSGDVFPFHLASVEAFRAAKRVLLPGGVLAMNYIGAPDGRAFACLYATVAAVFSHVRAIKGESGDDVQTITLLAADRPIEFNNGWLDLGGAFSGVDPIADAIERLTVTPARLDGFVLRDDYNPIDFLRADEAVRWRQRTARHIGTEALF